MLTNQYIRALVVVAVLTAVGVVAYYLGVITQAPDGVTLPVRATETATAPAASQAPTPAAATPAPSLPPAIVQLAIVRGTMLAIDHGLKTGNFTVLRDIGSTKFQKFNSAARLGQAFATLSNNGVDLLPTAVVDPQFTKPAEITSEKMLHLTGVFPIQPKQAAFEIFLEMEDGSWRLFGVTVAPAGG